MVCDMYIPAEIKVVLPPSEGRSSGTHISDIIRRVGSRLGIPPYNKKDTLPENTRNLLMATGIAWERYIREIVPEIGGIIGELRVDDIIGTPDGLSFDSGEYTVDEIKVTWSSARYGIDEKWGWEVQGMSYCYMVSRILGVPCSRVRYFVLFINGDYKPSLPQLVRYSRIFTPAELQDNWAMLRNNMEVPADAPRTN